MQSYFFNNLLHFELFFQLILTYIYDIWCFIIVIHSNRLNLVSSFWLFNSMLRWFNHWNWIFFWFLLQLGLTTFPKWLVEFLLFELILSQLVRGENSSFGQTDHTLLFFCLGDCTLGRWRAWLTVTVVTVMFPTRVWLILVWVVRIPRRGWVRPMVMLSTFIFATIAISLTVSVAPVRGIVVPSFSAFMARFMRASWSLTL